MDVKKQRTGLKNKWNESLHQVIWSNNTYILNIQFDEGDYGEKFLSSHNGDWMVTKNIFEVAIELFDYIW